MPNIYTPELVNELKELTKGLARAEGVKAVRKHLGLSERAARNAYARYVEGEVVIGSGAASEITREDKGDSTQYTVDGFNVKTIDDVIKVCNVDRNAWMTKRFSVGQRPDGRIRWNASFERNKFATSTFVDDLKEDLKQLVVAPAKTKVVPVKGGCLLEIALFDLHLGKLGWKPEAGGDYDMKIARTVFFAAIHELVEKAQKQGDISRILFPVGNDYLTIDSDSNETTRGTPQDVDSRFAKIYREGRKMLVEAIELLRQIAPVDVIVVAGNHDNQSMFHLGDALECWFHGHDDVNVDNEPISRKYYQFGQNMICFSHGYLEKHSQLPQLAAVEQPAMWAATTYREWHLGHLHHESVKEYMGTNVRILPSLTGADRYHHDNGYVGSKRSAQAFRFHEVNGLEAVFNSTPVEG